MKPEIKAQWIQALRSGEYKQWTGVLRSPMGYCCLGVLCDLHKRATSQIWDYNERSDGYAYLGYKFNLPEEVIEWAGLDEEDPVVYSEDTGESLAHYNDEKGYSFEQISNLIENHL
jgi:hypothetical protein